MRSDHRRLTAWLVERMADESGRSLPAALVAVAVGAILLSPFFAHVSTRMLASSDVEDSLDELYAADAGVEFGIWKLLNDAAFRTAVDMAYPTPLTVTPAVTVNQISPSVTAAAATDQGWSGRASAPANASGGGALAYIPATGLIYAFRGDKQTDFWSYDPAADAWTSLPDAPEKVGDGGALLTVANRLYALGGDKSSEFWLFDGTNWNSQPDAPEKVGGGGALAYDGAGTIYALRGDKSTDFWSFTIGSGWNAPLPATPDKVGSGGALVYVGGSLYALRGDKSQNFWRYSGGSWTSLANTPAAVGGGGALVHTGGDYIYALQGDKSTGFWRYSLSANSWEVLNVSPGIVGDGGALVFPGGDYVYALQGDKTAGYWRYLAVPPKYDLTASAGGFTTTARVQLEGSKVTVLFWDID